MNQEAEEQHQDEELPPEEDQEVEPHPQAPVQPKHSVRKSNVPTATVKKIMDLLFGHRKEKDYERIQKCQQEVLISLAVQYGISVALLYIADALGLGKHITGLPAFVQIAVFGVFMICMILAQFGGEEYQGPPSNIQLCVLELFCKTNFFTLLTFTYPILKFKMFILIVTVDFLLILLHFKRDQSQGKENCFKLWDNKWRIFFTFVLQEVTMNLTIGVTSQTEVYAWFLVFFLIYCFILLHIQLIEHRDFMFEFYNSRYLSAVLLESDVFFPCYLMAKHWHCCDHTQPGFAII